MRQDARRNTALGGFTLVELIVVVVLLGIVAGLAVPRIVGGGLREARGELIEVQGQLSAAAFRHAVSGTHARISYDENDENRGEGEVELVMEVLAPEDAEAEVPTMMWLRDRFSGSVTLDRVTLEEVRVDGYQVEDEASWEIVFVAGQSRPPVEITLGMDGGEREWVVELLPAETVARVRDADDAGGEPDEIDLDAEGLGEVAW